MRILFVSTNLPIPTNNGRAIRSLSIIGGLVSCGHEVTFLSFAGKSRPEMLYPLSSYCREIDLLEWELTSFSQDSDYLGRIGSLVRRKAYSDRKSTRLNSSHRCISYAVFCLKKKTLKTLQ